MGYSSTRGAFVSYHNSLAIYAGMSLTDISCICVYSLREILMYKNLMLIKLSSHHTHFFLLCVDVIFITLITSYAKDML